MGDLSDRTGGEPIAALGMAEHVTAWTRPERPGRGPVEGLTRQQIVRAAIVVADREGPQAVSMRRIAAEVGAGTMSLYWHIASKDDLLDLMLDEIFGEMVPDAPPSGDWRADLRLIAEESRAVMQRHGWLASFIGGRTPFGPNMLAHIEFSLAAVDGLGLDNATMRSILSTVDDYVQGAVLRDLTDREIRRRAGLGEGEWRATIEPYLRQVAAEGRYPTLARFFAEDTPLDPEARFAFGLDCLLDGIAVRIAAARGAA